MNDNIKLVLDNIFELILDCSQSPNNRKTCATIYRNILDNYAICLVIDTFENEKILKAIMQLSTLQRLIIVFSFILAFDMKEISVVVRTSPQSVYSQKSKAISKMRIWLSAAETVKR